MTNSIRPVVVASLRVKGEAQDALPAVGSAPEENRPTRRRRGVVGGGMLGRPGDVKEGDLLEDQEVDFGNPRKALQQESEGP